MNSCNADLVPCDHSKDVTWCILCAREEIARLRQQRDCNIEMGLEVGQILGPNYDGADFRAIARELVSTKADLARRQSRGNEAIRNGGSLSGEF